MPRELEPIRKGQAITAVKLKEFTDGINTLNREAVDPPDSNTADPGVPVESAASPTTYIETSRTTSEVQVFDDEGTNYALIDRIDLVTFENSEGDIITLQFNNT